MPLARTLPVAIGGKNAVGGEQSGADVDDRHTRFGRRCARIAGGTHDAGHALGNGIVAAAFPVRTTLPKPRKRGVNNLRIDLTHCVVAQPEAVHDPGSIVLHNDVTFGRQLHKDLDSPRIFVIEGHAQFIAVEHRVHRAFAIL